MAEKILNTRIRLKYDTLANWTSKNPALLEGELAIAYLGDSHTTATPDNGTHPVLFKVGSKAKEDGTQAKFNELPWASALAADVYGWAKKEKLEFGDIPQEVIEAIKGSTDTNDNTTYAFDIVDGKLQVTETPHVLGVAGTPVTTSYDFVTPEELTAILANYYTKDEVNTELGKKLDKTTYEAYINGKSMSDAELKTYADGQASAAQTAAEATAASALSAARTAITTEIGQAVAPLATTEALNNVDAKFADYTKTADLPKDLGDFTNNADYAKTADVVTNAEFIAFEATNTQAIENAAKAGTDASAAVLGTADDAATANTVYGAKAAAAAAQSDATIAKTKIETFLDVVAPEGSEIIDTLSEIQAELERLDDAVEIEKQLATKVDKTTYDAHLTTQAEKDTAQDKALADAITAQNKALTDAIAAEVQRADGKYEEKGVAQGLINALGTMAKEDKANYLTKNEIETQVVTGKLVADTIVSQASISANEIGAEILEVGTTGGEIKIDEAGGFQVIGSGSGSESVLFSLKAEEAMGEELVVDGTEQAKNSFNEWLGTEAIAKAAADAIVLPTVNNGKLTVTTGAGLTGSGEFTANQEGDTAIAVALSTETISSLGKADSAVQPGDLADIAKTGNVNDLVQTAGDILVFNCGSASTVI